MGRLRTNATPGRNFGLILHQNNANICFVEYKNTYQSMREIFMIRPIFAGAAALLFLPAYTGTAIASSSWQPPVVQECEMSPGSDCNVEAACPADMPFIVTGGGGIPMAPEDHSVAMTMNLPVSNGTWRVRWRNVGSGDAAIKVAVRIKCASEAAEAGW